MQKEKQIGRLIGIFHMKQKTQNKRDKSKATDILKMCLNFWRMIFIDYNCIPATQ